MEDLFTIELPDTVSESVLEELEVEIKQMREVADAGPTEARGDVASAVGLWIQLTGGVVGLLNKAAAALSKIAQLVQGKGIKGAQITFIDDKGGKVTIRVEEASERGLVDLIKATKQSSPHKPV